MLNNEVFLFFYNFAHQSAFLDGLLIFFAQFFPYLVILGAAIFLLFHHEIFSAEKPFEALAQKWKEIVLVFFSGISAWVLANLIKIIVQIPRPVWQFPGISPLLEKTGFSFPSGHATFYMALAFAIFFSHKKAGWYFILSAFLIGLARIATGVHFPLDILAGYFLGILIAYLVRYFYNRSRERI
jgi:undecaprenyl-diphosphatase